MGQTTGAQKSAGNHLKMPTVGLRHSFQWPGNDLKKERKCRYLERELSKVEGEKVINISQCKMFE